MGSWGIYPQESDGALDTFLAINKAANLELDRLYNEYNKDIHKMGQDKYHDAYYNYCGVVFSLLERKFFVGFKHVKLSHEIIKMELETLINDPANSIRSRESKRYDAIEKLTYINASLNKVIDEHLNVYLSRSLVGKLEVSEDQLSDEEKKKRLEESFIYDPEMAINTQEYKKYIMNKEDNGNYDR